MHANDTFRLVETLRFDGLTFPLLERHLRRMRRSADHFDLPFDAARLRQRLDAAIHDCGIDDVRKVRVTLGRDGTFNTSVESIDGERTQPRRLLIAGESVNSDNEMLRHRTTQRPVHARAQREAVAAGADGALLTNEHGNVTEGTEGNLFVQRGEQYVTPPLACGVLPGVFRDRLLDTQSMMAEDVLSVDDLRQADALFCCNAVHGWQRAVLAEPQRDAA